MGEAARRARQQLEAVFSQFDSNHDGKISRKELGHVLQRLDPKVWTRANVEVLLDFADTNRDGAIDFHEFVDWLVGGTRRQQEGVVKKRSEGQSYTSEMLGQLQRESERAPAAEGSARHAAALASTLPKPGDEVHKDDPHSVELLLLHYSYEEEALPEGASRSGALRWLRGALCRWSAGDLRYKVPAKWLLANRRLWGKAAKRQDPNELGFLGLQQLATEHLDTIARHYEERAFKALGLGSSLGHLGQQALGKPAAVRQDQFLKISKGLLELGHTGGDGNPTWNYAMLLLTAAHAVDWAFQERSRAACEAAGGSARAAKPKSLMRILAKATTDHAGAVEPRSAENLDTNRAAWTFDSPEALCRAFEAAAEAFGPPVRVKNGYSPDFDALSNSQGYRSILANYLFRLKGLTWGMLAQEPVTRDAWQAFRDGMLGQLKMISSCNSQRDLSTDFTYYLRSADMSSHLFVAGELSEAPVELVVEVQYMMRPYLEMRKATHFWYKLVRAQCAESLQVDFMGL